MSPSQDSKLGTFFTLSIGIGGMVGGGIFAVTGLTIEVTRGGAPIAFLIAGIVALLTSYSYLKLTLRFPGEGGIVDFLNRAFGGGIVTGAANMLLLSYVVLVAVYAFAFGSYGASLFPATDRELWSHILCSGVIVALVVVNVFAANLVIRSENAFNLVKMLLLAAFIVAGFLTPKEWARLSPESHVPVPSLIASAMLIFLNYEGFELIANASKDAANNSTFFSTGRLTYIIAKTGELPRELERSVRGQYFEGTLITAALALFVANFVPLEAIATMGSAVNAAALGDGGVRLGLREDAVGILSGHGQLPPAPGEQPGPGAGGRSAWPVARRRADRHAAVRRVVIVEER